MTLRVMQWATGGVGRAAIEGIVAHPELELVAAELGFDVDAEVISTHEVAVSNAPIDSPIGVIAPGLVAAQRERFEVEVCGDPSSQVTFHGWHPESIAAGLIRNPGIVATANHCISAIPYVCAAAPGIKTYLDLPLIAGRAAANLSRQGNTR